MSTQNSDKNKNGYPLKHLEHLIKFKKIFLPILLSILHVLLIDLFCNNIIYGNIFKSIIFILTFIVMYNIFNNKVQLFNKIYFWILSLFGLVIFIEDPLAFLAYSNVKMEEVRDPKNLLNSKFIYLITNIGFIVICYFIWYFMQATFVIGVAPLLFVIVMFVFEFLIPVFFSIMYVGYKNIQLNKKNIIIIMLILIPIIVAIYLVNKFKNSDLFLDLILLYYILTVIYISIIVAINGKNRKR